MLIRCSLCGKQDKHYTQNRNTSIGCWQFTYPLVRRYVCDTCIAQYIQDKTDTGTAKEWLPKEILR